MTQKHRFHELEMLHKDDNATLFYLHQMQGTPYRVPYNENGSICQWVLPSVPAPSCNIQIQLIKWDSMGLLTTVTLIHLYHAQFLLLQTLLSKCNSSILDVTFLVSFTMHISHTLLMISLKISRKVWADSRMLCSQTNNLEAKIWWAMM